jgi:hypothetical protein
MRGEPARYDLDRLACDLIANEHGDRAPKMTLPPPTQSFKHACNISCGVREHDCPLLWRGDRRHLRPAPGQPGTLAEQFAKAGAPPWALRGTDVPRHGKAAGLKRLVRRLVRRMLERELPAAIRAYFVARGARRG